MKWKTSISQFKDNELYIRGNALSGLIDKHSFSEVVFLMLAERLPSEAEDKMFNSILVSIVDHTPEVPTGFVPRSVASTGNAINVSVAAGILSVGDYHGGALEGAMRAVEQAEDPKAYVAQQLAAKKRIPGFGHKYKGYKKADPRAAALFSTARELGLETLYMNRMEKIGIELRQQSGKQLPLNVDGASAAILVTFGFDARLGKAIFAFGRMPGMIAHAFEEMQNEKPYRRFTDEDIVYVGP